MAERTWNMRVAITRDLHEYVTNSGLRSNKLGPMSFNIFTGGWHGGRHFYVVVHSLADDGFSAIRHPCVAITVIHPTGLNERREIALADPKCYEKVVEFVHRFSNKRADETTGCGN